MQTASYIFSQVQALLDDGEASWADDDYLRPLLQSAQDDFVNECLKDPNIGELKGFVVLAGVQAGLQSLAQELLPAGRLGLLVTPIELREKKAGDSDVAYTRMIPAAKPVYTSGRSLNGYYTFTGSDILLPGATDSVDIWVWGAFKPAPITSADTPLVPDTETVLKYATARLAARARGNRQLAQDFHGDQIVQQSAWMRNVYKTQQTIRISNLPWHRRSLDFTQFPIDDEN